MPAHHPRLSAPLPFTPTQMIEAMESGLKYFLVLELVRGGTLADVLQHGMHLPLQK